MTPIGDTPSGLAPERPLRVLMVLQRLLPYFAGAEIQAIGLAKGLASRGVDVRFLSTRYVPGLARHEVVRGVQVDRVNVVRGPALKPSQMVATARWVLRNAERFDIVHAHCLSSAALGAAAGAAMRRTPVLVKPSLGGSDGEMAKLRASVSWPLMRGILRRVTRFAALDAEIAAEVRDAGVADDAIARIDNGIDVDAFRPAEPSERVHLRGQLGLPDGPLVLFLGQLVDRKGIVETLDAWRSIAVAAPDASLVVAGTGPRAPEVEAAAAESGSRVRYLGVLDDVAGVLRASDVLVLPSRNESFGNAIVEAMACGLPVVVGRTGVGARLEIDGAAGIVLDRIDTESVAGALGRLLSDPAAARRMGEHGRELAREFSFDRITTRYLAIYREMLARG